MWHGAKNLGKKLFAVAQERGNESLRPWVEPVVNHFYHAAETCEGDALKLSMKMVAVLNHTANVHRWILGECDNEALDEDQDRGNKQWLDPTGHEIVALEKVVRDTRFLGNLYHYTTCQTTSELESFHNHLLMYASKRQAYTCQLAAIDYMQHLDRPYKKDANGELCYKRKFSKRGNKWTVYPVKVTKAYSYIEKLMVAAVNEYCIGQKRIYHPIKRQSGDPRNIASTIASIEPPPTAEHVAKRKSRLAKWRKNLN
ncbi:uncharacterized protein LOC127839007 isoform X2 [Dreissena polymorpha]|uniref:uncharacterized protein LOC127839007 isoform X2 n=1 Tax=Dreissena polymorpha TaxID=45954 RepID=UPI002264FC97|nr:uncharacterized protein LOC127839007 isoform X2 [Dreissena polymorpha]